MLFNGSSTASDDFSSESKCCGLVNVLFKHWKGKGCVSVNFFYIPANKKKKVKKRVERGRNPTHNLLLAVQSPPPLCHIDI